MNISVASLFSIQGLLSEQRATFSFLSNVHNKIHKACWIILESFIQIQKKDFRNSHSVSRDIIKSRQVSFWNILKNINYIVLQ